MELHKEIKKKLDTFIETKKVPNLIFHGASSSGKMTIVIEFLNKIYNNDKQLIKSNVMMVNCSQGKGIKFIRDELKLFAKSNLNTNNNLQFKTIILLNGDNLTIDAQSALRRCIEQFSNTTRFFMILENKYKLLQPILSRFCEIYVSEYVNEGEIFNLQKLKNEKLQKNLIDKNLEKTLKNVFTNLNKLKLNNKINLKDISKISSELYEDGINCMQFIDYFKYNLEYNEYEKYKILMYFDKIRSEYRNEKLLLLTIMNYIYFRSNDDLKSITTI
tara:strand:- start:707 stop:1528 length:822 start_codon:yes stop_codon:yes gene_type:complete